MQLTYYMLGTTTKLVKCCSSSRVVVTLERNILLELKSEINIKTVQKQEDENVKRCRDGMPKSLQKVVGMI